MPVDVTWNGKTVRVDPKSMETQRYILIHELGHYCCARYLGYDGDIVFDTKNGVFSTRLKYMPAGLAEAQLCKDQVVICYAGSAAEELFGVNIGGFLGDLMRSFNFLKELYRLEGMEFKYESLSDMPEKVCEPYAKEANRILEEIGGKDFLEQYADNLLKDIA